MRVHPLVSMILRRLALGLLTLFVISLFIFMAIELLPGDLAEEVLGQSATPETVAAFRRELGLDQPAVLRYLTWLIPARTNATLIYPHPIPYSWQMIYCLAELD